MKIIEQISDAALKHRMYHLSRDFRQWLKHKSSLLHTRVGNVDVLSLYGCIPIQKQIEIDFPWTPSLFAQTSQALFDLQKFPQ